MDLRVFPHWPIPHENMVFPPFSKWLPLPRGISPRPTGILNKNVIVCRFFTCLFNCNSITFHSLNPRIVRRHLTKVIWKICPPPPQKGFISSTWTNLQIFFHAPTIFHKYISIFMIFFSITLTRTPSYFHNIRETCIWLVLHLNSSCPEPSHMLCFQTHVCVQCKAASYSTSFRV